MTDNEFRLLLEAAVCGDREALDSLLALYMPLINRLSSYAGTWRGISIAKLRWTFMLR